jgi:quercetin dioxygenase-like cupin family protein
VVIQKRNLKDVPFRAAPNRRIAELVSARTGDSQGVTLRIVDMVPAPEQQPRHPHRHSTFEETIFVIKGEGRLWAEGELYAMVEGDAVVVPAGTFHMILNATPEPMRLACFFPIAESVGVDQEESTGPLLVPEQIIRGRTSSSG